MYFFEITVFLCCQGTDRKAIMPRQLRVGLVRTHKRAKDIDALPQDLPFLDMKTWTF